MLWWVILIDMANNWRLSKFKCMVYFFVRPLNLLWKKMYLRCLFNMYLKACVSCFLLLYTLRPIQKSRHSHSLGVLYEMCHLLYNTHTAIPQDQEKCARRNNSWRVASLWFVSSASYRSCRQTSTQCACRNVHLLDVVHVW